MGKFLLIVTLLGDLPGVDGNYHTAATQSRYALLEEKSVQLELQEFQDDMERTLYHYTGLKKEELVYGAYVYPLVAGKISSKPFKNFKYTFENGYTLRPEIEYKFQGDREFSNFLILTKEF